MLDFETNKFKKIFCISLAIILFIMIVCMSFINNDLLQIFFLVFMFLGGLLVSVILPFLCVLAIPHFYVSVIFSVIAENTFSSNPIFVFFLSFMLLLIIFYLISYFINQSNKEYKIFLKKYTLLIIAEVFSIFIYLIKVIMINYNYLSYAFVFSIFLIISILFIDYIKNKKNSENNVVINFICYFLELTIFINAIDLLIISLPNYFTFIREIPGFIQEPNLRSNYFKPYIAVSSAIIFIIIFFSNQIKHQNKIKVIGFKDIMIRFLFFYFILVVFRVGIFTEINDTISIEYVYHQMVMINLVGSILLLLTLQNLINNKTTKLDKFFLFLGFFILLLALFKEYTIFNFIITFLISILISFITLKFIEKYRDMEFKNLKIGYVYLVTFIIFLINTTFCIYLIS